jgi:NADPH:quinone reductase
VACGQDTDSPDPCGSVDQVKAVVTTEASTAAGAPGAPAVAERPDPVPGAGEVLVRVWAAGINNADLLQARGFYPAPPGSSPDILGMELAGEVAANGPGATRFREGDRVMALVGGGAQAELAVLHERVLMPVPETMPWPEAGGFPEVFTTAHDALFTQGELTPGARVCIHGAAGGVGTAAVQLAAAVNAQVVATVRNPAHRPDVEALAPGRVTAIAPEGFAGHGPFDLVLELIGAPNIPDDLAALKTGGRIIVIGVGAGADAQVNLFLLMMAKARIQASTLRSRPLEQKADAARRIEAQVLPLAAEGLIRVPVAATYPLEDAPAAYARFAEGAKLGKIVLTVEAQT